jgi:hypothetical protein
MSVHIGLDISLKSPGMAIYESAYKKWSLYGFAQVKRQIGQTYQTDAVYIELLPPIPNIVGVTPNESRYEHIRHYFVDKILIAFLNSNHVTVAVENYAFSARNSGSAYKLQELGGVLKHSIWCRFPSWKLIMVPPSRWKKLTVGCGNATKVQTVDYVRTVGPSLCLLSVLGYSIISSRVAIPCPVQDMADAACICLSIDAITVDSVSLKRKRA